VCGFGGVLDIGGQGSPSLEALGRIAAALEHRGPDEAGVYLDDRVGLAHARLAIIDPDTGQQPLCSPDGRVWIAFNGEIFNDLELRETLAARGHRFRTRSDTEVLAAAWSEWGDACLERLHGQWAFAAWEPDRRRLVLCRDRVGICPLFFAEHGGRLLFASEVKGLFAAEPGLRRGLDPTVVAETFVLWAPIAPRSVFTGGSELPPGHLRAWEDGRTSGRRYWDLRFREAPAPAKPVEAVRAALERATAQRVLRADVPVGTYLSGGLDSSLLAALGRRVAIGPFHSFSLRFEDADLDETSFARTVAERLGTVHTEITVTETDVARVFPDMVRHAERPVMRTAPAPLFLLSERARAQGIKVVLTGEGADEVFGGYDLFREGKVRRFWARRPDSPLRPALLKRLYPYLSRSPVTHGAFARRFFGRDLHLSGEPGFAHALRWQNGAALLRLLVPGAREDDAVARLLATLPAELRGWSPLAQDQYIEVRTLLSGYLLAAQGDRMLMAHSVEGRFPFLDQAVLDVAGRLPDTCKLPGLAEKDVLKRVAAEWVPEAVIRRPKQPYRGPSSACFVAPDAPAWIAEVTTEAALADAGVFEAEPVRRLLEKCRTLAPRRRLSNADEMALAGVLSTQLLQRELIERPPAGGGTSGLRVIDRRTR